MRLDLSVRNTQATAANFRAMDATLQEEVVHLVAESGQLTKELTQFFCPVRTGFMRAHVRVWFGERGYSFEVGWDAADFLEAGLAFYPIFVEFGTRFAAAQPSLFPAYFEVQPGFVADLTEAIRRSAARQGLLA